MNTAANLRARGYNDEDEGNRAFVDSLFSLERRMRHPLETMGEGSSDEELSEDEQGPYLLPMDEARKRHFANKKQEQQPTAPQKATTSQQGAAATASQRTQGIAPAPAPAPMEGVQELRGAQKGISKAPNPTKKTTNGSVARVAPVKKVSSRAPPLPPSPSAPPVAATSRLEPLPRTLHVPKPPPFPRTLHSTSAALPAGNTRTSVGRSSRPSKRPASSIEDSDSEDVEIIEQVSSPPKKIPAPLPSTSKKASPKKSAAPSPKKKRGKVPTVKEAWTKDDKMGAKAIQEKWQTLANYIDHLNEVADENPPKSKILSKFRILIVHPDITNGESSPNRIDAYLVRRIGQLMELGARLVKPQEFVARSPSSSFTDGDANEWTTHVIVPEIHPGLRIRFEKVLGCLGLDPQGITVEQLGDAVHVVREKWAWDYEAAVKFKTDLPDEADYYLPDDPRHKPTASTSPRKKNKGKTAKGKGKGKAKAGEYDTSDSSGAEDGEDKEAERASISPFGTQDYPLGEKPPPRQLLERLAGEDKAKKQRADGSASSDHLAVEPMAGLHKEFAYIKKHGADQVDRELKFADQEHDRLNSEARGELHPLDGEDTTILDERSDDNETEEEEEEEERKRYASKRVLPDGWREFVTNKGKKKFRPPPKGYACDRGSSTDPSKPGPNESIARVLDQLSIINKGDEWRERGYSKAAAALRNCPYPVTTHSEARELYGIGERIASKIVEVIQTGTHRRLSMSTNYEKIISVFSNIYGVGRSLAEIFYDKGARTLHDLKAKPELYNVREPQMLGLKYYDDLLQRIPRDEVTRLFEYARAAAAKIDPKLEVHCMGSYRRGAMSCGDIDLLVTRDPSDGKDHTGMIAQLWDMLKEEKIIAHELTSSDDWNALDAKYNALCSLPQPGSLMRRLDILGVPFDELPACLIYFTGDDHFNRSMRLKARHLGYRLNQRGLYKDVTRGRDGTKLTEGSKVLCKTEKDIFKLLSVPWRPPEQRRCS
ncbi:hypothetical protein BCR35DRAFT_304784 [Leucosporidium creatinivorum]|uniref:DNA-directed DNA polymerase n=1 Tax=Leucosporidium creatinivorum TaxID=106004 RepID=A0A1Y2F662_9BASI|nr:hypothetical protein BCR35DRAFT_304784 [Leucosporidium creatinivorum]